MARISMAIKINAKYLRITLNLELNVWYVRTSRNKFFNANDPKSENVFIWIYKRERMMSSCHHTHALTHVHMDSTIRTAHASSSCYCWCRLRRPLDEHVLWMCACIWSLAKKKETKRENILFSLCVAKPIVMLCLSLFHIRFFFLSISLHSKFNQNWLKPKIHSSLSHCAVSKYHKKAM